MREERLGRRKKKSEKVRKRKEVRVVTQESGRLLIELPGPAGPSGWYLP